MKDFKQFLLRGNVVDLAVGIVIGAAFGAVVTALVKDLLTPLIAVALLTPMVCEPGAVITGGALTVIVMVFGIAMPPRLSLEFTVMVSVAGLLSVSVRVARAAFT